MTVTNKYICAHVQETTLFRGSINLRSVVDVVFGSEDDTEDPLTFRVICTRRTYCLTGDDSSDVMDWVNMIQKFVGGTKSSTTMVNNQVQRVITSNSTVATSSSEDETDVATSSNTIPGDKIASYMSDYHTMVLDGSDVEDEFINGVTNATLNGGVDTPLSASQQHVLSERNDTGKSMVNDFKSNTIRPFHMKLPGESLHAAFQASESKFKRSGGELRQRHRDYQQHKQQRFGLFPSNDFRPSPNTRMYDVEPIDVCSLEYEYCFFVSNNNKPAHYYPPKNINIRRIFKEI